MYDTIRLKSPYISKEVKKVLDEVSKKKYCIDVKSQEIIYEFTNVDLKGSFDSRIMIQVRDYIWIKSDGDTTAHKQDSRSYFIVECSIHKLIFAQNVVGGIDEFQKSCYLLIKFLEKTLNIELPNYLDFEVERIDYSKNYYIEKDEKIHYLRGLNLISYPRRKVNRFASTGISIAGSTTTNKVYDKYEEFKKHDRKRLKGFELYFKSRADKDKDKNINKIDDVRERIKYKQKLYGNKINDFVEYLENISQYIIRFETGIKKRKLKYDLEKDFIFVKDIKDKHIKNIYKEEIQKMLKINDEGLKTYNKSRNVIERLKNIYGDSKGVSLYNFWVQYTTFGEDFVRENYSRTQFYKKRKELKNAQIDLNQSDLKVVDNKVIEFNPFQAKEVTEFENKYIKKILKDFISYVA